MRKLLMVMVLAQAMFIVGCGAKTTINTAPLTEEQKRQIAEDDKRVADEESQGSSGKASKKGKKN